MKLDIFLIQLIYNFLEKQIEEGKFSSAWGEVVDKFFTVVNSIFSEKKIDKTFEHLVKTYMDLVKGHVDTVSQTITDTGKMLDQSLSLAAQDLPRKLAEIQVQVTSSIKDAENVVKNLVENK